MTATDATGFPYIDAVAAAPVPGPEKITAGGVLYPLPGDWRFTLETAPLPDGLNTAVPVALPAIVTAGGLLMSYPEPSLVTTMLTTLLVFGPQPLAEVAWCLPSKHRGTPVETEVPGASGIGRGDMAFDLSMTRTHL